MGAIELRILEEEEVAKAKEFSCIGCTNRATHTWSGYPTCDKCGLPGRKSLPFSTTRGIK